VTPEGPDDDDEAVLARLFLEELEAQLPALEGGDAEASRRAIHKLKGSAGLVGHRALSDAFGRLERRLAEGDPEARADARRAVEETLAALREGRPVPAARWPVPPPDLRPTPIDPSLRDDYRGAMLDRLRRLDEALAAVAPEDGALAAYREVHAIKGAALAVGDEVTGWFCHGLEERLAGAHTRREEAASAVAEVARHRAVLGELLVDPSAGLATLRLDRDVRTSLRPGTRTSLPLPPRRPASRAAGEPPSNKPDATVRVGADTLQDVFDRLSRLGQIPGPLGAGVADLRSSAADARDVHRGLLEARRRIGPPRPWGPPAAAVDAIERGADRVASLASRLERVADRVLNARGRVSADTTAAQATIASMRTTDLAELFDRVRAAALGDARRAGRPIEIEIEGADASIDRETAEALVDPLLQLARNAVAHGLEAPEERVRRGKPAAGTLRLTAESTAGALAIGVEDDGAGVDLAGVRRRAIESGALAPELASLVDDARLLGFLFRPGFSTRAEADLLAGRGVGLDVVLAATHRAGGTLRLRTREGFGFAATISLPSGASLLDVLWVRAGATWLALPAAHVLSIVPAAERPATHLADLLGQPREQSARATLRLGVRPRGDSEGLDVGVDEIAGRDEVHLRPIEPVVRATGPWAAAIAWGDEIRMSVDPGALLELSRAGR
jgi:two-component system chemotaxis sensor kinase CheA